MSTIEKDFTRKAHDHLWLVGALGIAIGVAIMIFAPGMEVAAKSTFLFAGFHVLGGVVLLASMAFIRTSRAGSSAAATPGKINFGWASGWMNGLGLAALTVLALALVLQISHPAAWPASYGLLLLAFGFALGNGVVSSFRRHEYAVLPMVGLFNSDSDRVLDIGCGAGRTTLALAAAAPGAQISSLDLFDAPYIEGGGMGLLRHNLKLKGLEARVGIVQGDITAMPFEEASFDAAASTAVYDHLGSGKQKGVDEAFRVLRPGGRFLMSVWVPSWSVFAVGNIFSFMLTRRAGWREMAAKSGFQIVDEGFCNFSWYLLMQKPGSQP